jgi:hypothetical protein
VVSSSRCPGPPCVEQRHHASKHRYQAHPPIERYLKVSWLTSEKSQRPKFVAPLDREATLRLRGTGRAPLRLSAACLVAASDSWPLIDVAPPAGSRSGSLSDPLGAHRRMHESFSLGRSVARPVESRLEQRSDARPRAPASMRAGGRPSRTVCGPSHRASLGTTNPDKGAAHEAGRPRPSYHVVVLPCELLLWRVCV